MIVRFLALTLFALAGLVATALTVPTSIDAALVTTSYIGDTDCDEMIDVHDALNIVRHEATVTPDPLCISLGNVLCADELNLEDMLALLEFIAGFPVDLSAACFPLGGAIPSAVVAQDTTTIYGTHAMDFDTGTTGGDGVDAWWSIDASAPDPLEAQLVAAFGSRFAVLTGTDYGAINAAFLGTTHYTNSPINGSEGPANQLANGAVFAVRTSQGNLAKVQVVQHGYDLQIEWVTYAGPD